MLLTAVLLIVSGLTNATDAVFKLMHDFDINALLSSVHVNGVIKLGNIGNTIIR